SLNFDDSLRLNDLNLICGSNSSGKSSILQIILMLAQSVGGAQSRRSVTLNGPLVKLGGFEDIKCSHGKNDDIRISAIVKARDIATNGISKIILDLKFGFGEKGVEEIREQLDPELIHSYIEVHQRTDKDEDAISKIFVEKEEKTEFYHTGFSIKEISGDYFDEYLSKFPSWKLLGCSMSGFIPIGLNISYDSNQTAAHTMVQGGIKLC
ncbi:AAA family ATPase, partial [Shewanella xiamenensis]|uniref:AAA family ATPase n=1 Tax=Shewanella xiamenensis TaxID=332186 RepID=UPI00155951A5